MQVVIAESKPVADTTDYLSILKSRRSSTINPQVEGYVTEIYVKSGDQVKTGAPLLQIDPVKQEATLHSQDAARAAQEANVRNAKLLLERAQKLFDAGVISKQDFDNAQTNYDASAAQLKSLEHQVQQQNVELQYYRVTAPKEGVVGDIPIRVGDRVTVSTMLTTIDELEGLEAYIYVPASRAHDLRLGLPVRLLDQNGSTIYETAVTFISPQMDPDTQTVLAKAAIGKSNAHFRVAQQVRTQLVWTSRNSVVIPVLSVQRINGQFFVFVAAQEAKGTAARQRSVKLGETVDNDYVILEGIQPGDHLIVSGLQFLQDGVPVTEQIQNAKVAPGSASKSGSKPQ
ncbi:MAG TPA: efflux RND transporter periplasmic adaptor subunit [Candidatus Eremiobacteraceae bacterium]|nr:efflux RND transporter periplasmic adaptor subunit [Candidatus Eremiobacteraceae bacterium]